MSELNIFQKWWMNAWPHRWRVRRQVPRFLKSSPDPIRGEVLEIGAGRGWTSRRILDTFPQVELTATDIDPQATKTYDQLQGKYGRRLKVKEANVLQLPFDRDSYDIVLAINIIRHLRPYGIRKSVQEMLRVVRPGGLIGISEYSMATSKARLCRESIEQALAEEECDVVHTREDSHYDLWIRKKYPVEEK